MTTPTLPPGPPSAPPRRADARRNREQLLTTAREMLARCGTQVSMDEIARASGLGSGTLYRHFPRRRELIAAVLADLMSQALTDIEAATAITDPARALRAGLRAVAATAARNRALLELLIQHLDDPVLRTDPDLTALRARTLNLLAGLVCRAQGAGALRLDITVTDLPPLLAAIGGIHVPGADPAIWERYLDLVMDGLRPQPSGRLTGKPPPVPGWPA